MKKILQAFLVVLSLGLYGYSSSLRAEDVDIYVDNAANSDAPNVLFVIDNTASASSTVSAGCQTYKGTNEAPSLGIKTGFGVIQCALVDAINSMPNKAMKIGIMMGNASNFATTRPAAGTAGYHELCNASGLGGCLLRPMVLLEVDPSDPAKGTKADLVKFIKSWSTSSASDANNFNIKVNEAPTGAMMQEAWAYYNGKTGISTTNYGTSLLQTGCQRNFVIFIANTDKTPPTGEKPSPYDSTYGLTAAQTNAVKEHLLPIKETVFFDAPTCGKTSMPATNSASDWSSNWADEWARLMAEQDRGLEVQDGTQNIVTYTIGITPEACKPDYPALLSTMATYGRGKYFSVADTSQMTDALATVLNEVQAVNSVFSSASLPVSVNAEGSYLNQIFLGMFRPDSSANPRWMGNLKQYQLIRGQTGSLVLGDANNKAAISSAGTGFIAPTAVSFWTYKDDSVEPDAGGGFFRKALKGTPASGFDSADGEVVEKGGVAQQLRKENLRAAFGDAMGSSNPRRLFTYCPSGPLDSTCIGDLRDTANLFVAGNAGIPANAFGDSTTVAIRSIVRNGTTATVTTYGNHGFGAGTRVTITNAPHKAYNVVDYTLAAADLDATKPNEFKITGLADNPPSPTTGSFTMSSQATGAIAITNMVRTVSTTAATKETVTVTTAANHGFTTASTIQVQGATVNTYNYTGAPLSPSGNTFQFVVDILPKPSATGFQVAISSTTYRPIPSTSVSNPSSNTVKGNTGSIKHGFHVNQLITVSSSSKGSKYPGIYKVTAVTDFTFTAVPQGFNVQNQKDESVTVQPDGTAQAITSLSRNGTGDNTLATATGLPSNFFGTSTGDTKVVNISKSSGTLAADESAYAGTFTITCLNSGCTSFTYPITISPPAAITGSNMTVGLQGAATATLATISRTEGTATAVITAATGAFNSGDTVTISQNDATKLNEAAYAGKWTITCATSPCGTINFGPIVQDPPTPVTGNNMQAYSPTTAPDKNTVVRWVRGENNQGDENGPADDILVRGTIHGDVLHSRPVVLNYGKDKIVVFYGGNDGIFRAVNGNQSANMATSAGETVPAGGELWGLLLQEHFPYYNRLRLDSPELKFPSTILKSAQRKNYFIDGPTGVYQQLDANGNIVKAYLYLTMRRGGRFMYALDVTDPAKPRIMWRRSNLVSGFEEMGQTWSRPRLTLLQGSSTPVIVFGGGYDPAEDDEAPGAPSSGRAIYVLNAETGDQIWRAQLSCDSTVSTTATAEAGGITPDRACLAVPGMKHPIPSEIAFVDRDFSGRTDKFYFGDLGGNVWRADVSSAKTSDWRVTRVAALGCAAGECASGTTPRKFFYPPAVLSIRAAGDANSYDAVSLASGDREHPLLDTANPQSAYNTDDMFFMIKDADTVVGGSPTPLTKDVTLSGLVSARQLNVEGTTWDGTGGGFYIDFATGEKAVNAPLAVNGQIFFATNKPIPKDRTCVANLGQARAYAVSPFDGRSVSNVLQGGGMPPSAVSGLILVNSINTDGTTSETLEKFCIGCGTPGLDPAPGTPPCNSALENCNVGKTVPKNLKRTYWYKK
jgi:type IV pilus assembly protein PilY1